MLTETQFIAIAMLISVAVVMGTILWLLLKLIAYNFSRIEEEMDERINKVVCNIRGYNREKNKIKELIEIWENRWERLMEKYVNLEEELMKIKGGMKNG